MEYSGVLLAVRDMERSKRFYDELLGLKVADDFGACVALIGGVSLQTLESWREFLQKADGEIRLGGNDGELYFEEDDMDSLLQKLAAWPGLEYVHPLKEHRWGQRVVRFYDPDRHIVEVGEKIGAVVRRFLAAGLTVDETALRMDVSEEYIRRRMAGL